MIIAAALLSFIPAILFSAMVFWLDQYEREPKLLLIGIFLWGAVISVTQTLLVSSLFQIGIDAIATPELADLAGASVVAPVVEELAKGLAVFVVFLAARHEFDTVLDGIVYASVVALGFAATENTLYLWSAAQEGGVGEMLTLFVIRVVLGGWGHAVYTAWTGIGFALARLSHNWLIKILAPFAGVVVAMLIHSAFNTTVSLGTGLVGFAAFGIDWIGWFLVLGVALWAMRHEHRWLATYLKPEVDRQVLTAEHYQVACSPLGRARARIGALFGGNYRQTSRFYQVCGELAQKRHQQVRFGEESGNAAVISRLEHELTQLAPFARV